MTKDEIEKLEAAEKAVRERTRTSLYELSYQAGTPHAGETWSVYGDGFGLRCYAQKEQAVREATEFFGLARFVIRIWPEKSVLHVTTAPGADPEKLLNQAIDALKAELAELNKCPAHARAARLLTEGKHG